MTFQTVKKSSTIAGIARLAGSIMILYALIVGAAAFPLIMLAMIWQ